METLNGFDVFALLVAISIVLWAVRSDSRDSHNTGGGERQ